MMWRGNTVLPEDLWTAKWGRPDMDSLLLQRTCVRYIRPCMIPCCVLLWPRKRTKQSKLQLVWTWQRRTGSGPLGIWLVFAHDSEILQPLVSVSWVHLLFGTFLFRSTQPTPIPVSGVVSVKRAVLSGNTSFTPQEGIRVLKKANFYLFVDKRRQWKVFERKCEDVGWKLSSRKCEWFTCALQSFLAAPFDCEIMCLVKGGFEQIGDKNRLDAQQLMQINMFIKQFEKCLSLARNKVVAKE